MAEHVADSAERNARIDQMRGGGVTERVGCHVLRVHSCSAEQAQEVSPVSLLSDWLAQLSCKDEIESVVPRTARSSLFGSAAPTGDI